MVKSLSDFTTLTFDCYGTLIDWESGIWDAIQPLIHANRRDDIMRSTGLEAYASIEAEQERETPDLLYPKLLTRVHRSLATHFNLESSETMDQTFGQSVPHWPAFADSADALRILKKHFKLVILSNVNRDGFAASARKLGVEFDAIYTAEDVGSYKPLAQLAGHLALLALTSVALAQAWGNGWVVPAILAHSIVLIFLFAPLHETIHFTVFETRQLNNIVAACIGLMQFLPYQYFRSFHYAHHRHTQKLELDPELIDKKPYTRRSLLWHISGLPLWRYNIRSIFRHATGVVDEAFLE